MMYLSKASSEDLLLFAGLLLCLFRFLSFLSHVALRYPSSFNASLHRRAYDEEYTTIQKLIRHVSNKVNGGGLGAAELDRPAR
jgi:hypothetical protein